MSPGETAAPVKLADEDVAQFKLQGRIHATAHSIGSAMVVRGSGRNHFSSYLDP
jgi:hypothetical protein